MRSGSHPPLRQRLGGARRLALTALVVLALVAALTATADAGKLRMHSAKVGPGLCETTGGGRIVAIPGFPGERIDRRLLADVRWLRRRYRIAITDGYSNDPVHATNGEHPMGLALDIVPDRAAGGSWRLITALARWAEPRRDRPRAPFRWVGYDGDPGHGRGHHLHLSWNHSVTRPGRVARTVYTRRCPGRSAPLPPSPQSPHPGDEPKPGADTDRTPSPTGGLSPRGRSRGERSATGGLRAKPARGFVSETGGVSSGW